MSFVLKPVLRPATLASLPSSTSVNTTYVCQTCRHARLLRRPKRPYTFTQLVTLSDGSAFTIRTTSPTPIYRSNRDTRNALLWNPSSKELMNVEDDEAGRLAGFRARFGKGFDAQRESPATAEDVPKPEPDTMEVKEQKPEKSSRKPQQEEEEVQYEFEEDDANLLDLISSYGQQGSETVTTPGKKEKKN